MHILPRLIIILFFILSSGCNIYKPVDARKVSPTGTERARKNIEECRSAGLFGVATGKMRGGSFEFASANELWRASLDVIDFMPLSSVNYSGGIIITDWYSEKNSTNESIKISIRFLTNEIRSDALDVKIFSRKCIDSLVNCNVSNLTGNLSTEIKKEILKRAASYKQRSIEESPNKDFVYPDTSGGVF